MVLFIRIIVAKSVSEVQTWNPHFIVVQLRVKKAFFKTFLTIKSTLESVFYVLNAVQLCTAVCQKMLTKNAYKKFQAESVSRNQGFGENYRCWRQFQITKISVISSHSSLQFQGLFKKSIFYSVHCSFGQCKIYFNQVLKWKKNNFLKLWNLFEIWF